MRYVRFQQAGTARWGLLAGETVHELARAPYLGGQETGATYPVAAVKLLAPAEPSKIVCVGRNYADSETELQAQAPSAPLIFLKPPSALVGPEEPICLPYPEHAVQWEAELAVVIGQATRNVSRADALGHVYGYTLANDVSDRDFQKADNPFGFGRAKAFDTFCPCGPVLVTEGIDPLDTVLTLTANGEVRQSGSTRLMYHSVADLIQFLSSIMTLQPGDLVLTGTPKGTGTMHPGDSLTISAAGIGTLTNSVAAVPSEPKGVTQRSKAQ